MLHTGIKSGGSPLKITGPFSDWSPFWWLPFEFSRAWEDFSTESDLCQICVSDNLSFGLSTLASSTVMRFLLRLWLRSWLCCLFGFTFGSDLSWREALLTNQNVHVSSNAALISDCFTTKLVGYRLSLADLQLKIIPWYFLGKASSWSHDFRCWWHQIIHPLGDGLRTASLLLLPHQHKQSLTLCSVKASWTCDKVLCCKSAQRDNQQTTGPRSNSVILFHSGAAACVCHITASAAILTWDDWNSPEIKDSNVGWLRSNLWKDLSACI